MADFGAEMGIASSNGRRNAASVIAWTIITVIFDITRAH